GVRMSLRSLAKFPSWSAAFKTMMIKQVSLIRSVVILFSFVSSGAHPKTLAESKPKRERLLISLRKRLDKVRTSKGEKPVEASAGDDVSFLVGMTRTKIKSALGAPHVCHAPIKYAPCKEEDDWFYSFYYLPSGYVGGGAELFLAFDRTGICKISRWVYTQ